MLDFGLLSCSLLLLLNSFVGWGLLGVIGVVETSLKKWEHKKKKKKEAEEEQEEGEEEERPPEADENVLRRRQSSSCSAGCWSISTFPLIPPLEQHWANAEEEEEEDL